MSEDRVSSPLCLAELIEDAGRELRRRQSNYADDWVSGAPPHIPLAEHQIRCQEAIRALLHQLHYAQGALYRQTVSDQALVELFRRILERHPRAWCHLLVEDSFVLDGEALPYQWLACAAGGVEAFATSSADPTLVTCAACQQTPQYVTTQEG